MLVNLLSYDNKGHSYKLVPQLCKYDPCNNNSSGRSGILLLALENC